MKKFTDGHKRDLQFEIGDLVFLKLQPYRQDSVADRASADRASNKLSARYFGPFKILKRIGQVAYQLELPSTARIHDVFHVSLLKSYKGDGSVEPMSLPQHVINIHPVLEPQHVLQERVILRHNKPIQQMLVQWQHMARNKATWEDVAKLKEKFPNFNLKDEVAVNGGSIDVNKEIAYNGIGAKTRVVRENIADVSEDEVEELNCQVEENMEEMSKVKSGRPKRSSTKLARYLD